MGEQTYDQWIGQDVYDCDDDKIGEIAHVFYDDVTGRPEWIAVKTGMFGSRLSFVPIAGAEIRADTDHPDDANLRVGYPKAMIKDAPNVDDADDHLTAVEEQDLYRHYGFAYEDRTAAGTYGANYGRLRPDVDYKAARYNRDRRTWENEGDKGGEVVAEATAVNEEVTKTAQPETVRLRKYRHTEMVPVQREEVRVEQEPGDKTGRS